MSHTRIVFNKPPTVSRVMTHIGRLARHEHFGERMTGEEAHKAAAVFFATSHAMKRDVLGNSWRGNRHIAAKCFELFQRVTSDTSFTQANYQPEVDINFS